MFLKDYLSLTRATNIEVQDRDSPFPHQSYTDDSNRTMTPLRMQKPGWVAWTAILDLSPFRMRAMRALPWMWSVLAVNRGGRGGFGGCFLKVTLGYPGMNVMSYTDDFPLLRLDTSKNIEHVEPETGPWATLYQRICFSEIILQPYLWTLPKYNITWMFVFLHSQQFAVHAFAGMYCFLLEKNWANFGRKRWFLLARNLWQQPEILQCWYYWKYALLGTVTYPLKRQFWRWLCFFKDGIW